MRRPGVSPLKPVKVRPMPPPSAGICMTINAMTSAITQVPIAK